MDQEETKAVPTPTEINSKPPAPAAIKPICPHCGTDPLTLKRLRYDFADGVVIETVFCAAKNEKGEHVCRAMLGMQIVGIDRAAIRR